MVLVPCGALGSKTLSDSACSPSGANLASVSTNAVRNGGAATAARTRGCMPSGEQVLVAFRVDQRPTMTYFSSDGSIGRARA